MAEYVNIAEIKKCISVVTVTYPDGSEKSEDVICLSQDYVHSLPTEDIVRCYECKHRQEYEEYDRAIDEFIDCSYCKRDGKCHDEDWFCADGIRRGGIKK